MIPKSMSAETGCNDKSETNLNVLRMQSLRFFATFNEKPVRGGGRLVNEEQLDRFRISGETVRIIRDELETNDVLGIVVAWDDSAVVIRRPNRRVVKLSRSYHYMSASEERIFPSGDAAH